MANSRGKLTSFLLVMQLIFAVFFGLFLDYENPVDGLTTNDSRSSEAEKYNRLAYYYPLYQDIHVMMLVGFGYLMTFLKRHGFGSIGFNFLLPCYVIEWATLVNGWFSFIETGNSKIVVNIFTLMEADFAVAAVLISFAAVVGKVSPIQLLIMATFEVVFYNIDLWVDMSVLEVIDIASSIHTFGAYFGLAVSRVLYKTHHTENTKETSAYRSDLFSMFGTLFLWLYWPSFNAGELTGNERHRAVINTIMSISACTVMTFAISSVTSKKNELNMPTLLRRLKIHDTCGVHNLHGLPGILGTMISSMLCDIATQEMYKDSFHDIFPDGRTGLIEGGYQMAGLVATVGIAVIGGTLTGFFLKIPIWDKLLGEELYNDNAFWQIPEDDTPTTSTEKVNAKTDGQIPM